MYVTNGYKKVVVVPHSMGANYFLHFLKWVETPTSDGGGGGGPSWCAKHIKAVVNIGPAFLGVPKAVSNLLSAEGKDIAYARLDPTTFSKLLFTFYVSFHNDCKFLDETSIKGRDLYL